MAGRGRHGTLRLPRKTSIKEKKKYDDQALDTSDVIFSQKPKKVDCLGTESKGCSQLFPGGHRKTQIVDVQRSGSRWLAKSPLRSYRSEDSRLVDI